MANFEVKKEDNYKVWASYEVMGKHKSIITSFIDDGILDDVPQCFEEFFSTYKSACEVFYNNLRALYSKYVGDLGDKELQFNINYKTRMYDLKGIEEQFDLDDFAIINLRLKDSFREKVETVRKKYRG